MKINSAMKPAAHMINNILIFPGWSWRRVEVYSRVSLNGKDQPKWSTYQRNLSKGLPIPTALLGGVMTT